MNTLSKYPFDKKKKVTIIFTVTFRCDEFMPWHPPPEWPSLCACGWPHVCVHAYMSVCVCDDVVAVDHALTEPNLAGDEYPACRVHFLLAFSDLAQEQ